MKFHLAVLLLAAVVHYVYAQYILTGYPGDDLSDDIGDEDGEVQGYDDLPIAAVPASAAIPYAAAAPYGSGGAAIQPYGSIPVADVSGLPASYDSQYTLIPVQVVPVYDDAPTYHREVRSKKKKKKGKKKKGWGWGWPKIKHIWLKAPKFLAHPPVVHIHPQPVYHHHKKVQVHHHGWGWGHGGGGGGGGGYKK